MAADLKPAETQASKSSNLLLPAIFYEVISMNQTVGMRLQQLRKTRGIKMSEVVRSTDIPRSTLYRYERFETNRIPLLVARTLAEFYQVDMHWLLDGVKVDAITDALIQDNRPYVEIPYDFKWVQPMIDAYCNANASTQKAVCAVLGLDRIAPQKVVVKHYLTEEELRVEFNPIYSTLQKSK